MQTGVAALRTALRPRYGDSHAALGLELRTVNLPAGLDKTAGQRHAHPRSSSSRTGVMRPCLIVPPLCNDRVTSP